MDVADFNQDGIADLAMTNNEALEVESVALAYGGGSAGVGNGMLGAPLRFGTDGADGRKVLSFMAWDSEGQPPGILVSYLDHVTALKSLCGVTPDGALELVSPVGGEGWSPGDEREISWTKGSGVTFVDLQVSRDSGVTWETIARDLTGTSFTWSVTFPNTINARVRVIDSVMRNRTDESGQDFYIGPATAVGEEPVPVDGHFRVSGVRPNPFRSQVTFQFAVPAAGQVDLTVLDVQGRVVRRKSLAAGSAGAFDMTWDGLSDSGESVPSGIYYARVAFAGQELVKTVARVR
jgi:hypothetical protein